MGVFGIGRTAKAVSEHRDSRSIILKSLGFSDFTQKHSHQDNICVNYYILSSNSTVKEGNKN